MASSPPPGELNLRAQIDITVLLSTLTERTYEGLVHQHSFLRDRAINDTIRTKMRLLCDLHGVEAYLFFIRWLLTYYAFAIRRRRAETSPSLAFRLLVQEVHGMARDPFLAPRFCHAIGEAIEDEPEFLQYFNLTHFVQQSNLGPLEKFVLASSIASTKSGSFNRELVEQGIRMARSNFDQAMGELVSRPNFEPPLRWTAASGLLSEAADNLSSSQLNELLDNVLIDSKGSILDARQRAKLISTTRSIFPMIVVIRESGNPSRTLSSFSSITVNGNAELSRVPLGTDPPRTASSKFGILTSQWYNTQTRTLNSKV
ncbi:uncharacterized protein EI90DRAFT_2987068 [Cantharellus anzutake]|uniref:uncharacterized protein n=1 Tax=Cantharellus anzutake TaxID=1750568 RepID=UPI001905CB7D|nr:uncharacterized protein EI90DRAFT_2987068 [Cantharellus anzutake]KAF8343806.1 hypothetical protein EI90DRAFT_2987068 [Cantharellus anzutake]